LTRSPRKTARFVAIETLCKLQRRTQPVTLLLEQLAEECSLIASDRHLAMNLTFGVLRQRQYLDNCLGLFSRHPLKKFHPFVHQALAVGLYQLLFLDRIPESAAVNETVNAMKVVHLPDRLQGFVNGVLRAIIRQRHLLPAPEALDKDGLPVLNHPAWLADRWQQNLGRQEMLRICACNNVQPQLVVRVNSSVIARDVFCTLLEKENIIARPGLYAPDAIILPDYHGLIHDLPGFARGFFQVQDESAQLVSLLLAPFTQDGNLLDGCAGLGGKTCHILELTADLSATVTAVEPDLRRLARLQENVTRLHPKAAVEIHPCSLLDFSRTCETCFHAILIDAPCSGTGVIRRHPDIRWNRLASDLPEFQKTQRQLLDLASEMLVPKGVLVYATCSLEPEENGGVVDGFLKTHPDFELSDCAPFLPVQAREFVHDSFFHPHPTESMDGFFAARLVKRSSNNEDFLCAGERPVVHF
jgi:16S rRNA (cytosine967-C5)-methyltransferase